MNIKCLIITNTLIYGKKKHQTLFFQFTENVILEEPRIFKNPRMYLKS